ncbi:MAG: YHS domain-containing (seleno)protein [Sedimentitalea sp.]
MLNRRHVLLGLAMAPLATPALAAKPEIYAARGAAIGGYDPVAFFTAQRAVKGKSAHTVAWRGATWQFSNAENRAAFEANPTQFAPQYGGYCSYAVSRGYTASTDPQAWTLHDGKLYLNYSLNVRSIWRENIPGNVRKANANWPNVLNA